MKTLSALLIVLAGLSGPLFALNETDFTVYRDDSHDFSFHYPKSWAPVDATHNQTRFKAVSEKGNGVEDVSINVIPNPQRKGSSPRAHIAFISGNPQAVVELLKKNAPSTKLVSHGKTKLSNQDAYFITVDFTYEAAGYSFDIRQIQYYTGRNGFNYTITMRCPRTEWNKSEKLFSILAARFILHPKF